MRKAGIKLSRPIDLPTLKVEDAFLKVHTLFLDNSKNFSIQSEPTTEGSYDVICMSLQNYGRYMVTLYKINQDYVSLFESEVQDGTELNEPPSNIINAFGIFTAFASDTTFFEIVRE